MIPPSAATTAPAVPPAIELSDREIAQLRSAAGWARFTAIAGLVIYGLVLLGYVAMLITRQAGAMSTVPFGVFLAVSVIGGARAATLVLGYARGVRSSLANGEPALAPAFRQLRLFFTVWMLLGALDIVFDVLSLLGKL